MDTQTSINEFHVVFLVLGIPPEFAISHINYGFARPMGEAAKTFDALAERDPVFKQFLGDAPTDSLHIASFRIKGDYDRSKAISHTLFRMNSLLDGYCLLKEIITPRLSPIILVRENLSNDLLVLHCKNHGWAHHHSKEGTEFEAWKQYETDFMTKLIPFFDIAGGDSLQPLNEIEQQILSSANMFRAGVESNSFAIEYLCKFAALEGLVCGVERNEKRKLLQTRLQALFSKTTVSEAMISDLWNKRSEAIHQSKALEHELLPNSYPLQVKTDDIHFLFNGALVFALESKTNHLSLKALWTSAGGFALPEWLRKPNPMHAHRVSLTLWVEDRHLTWQGMGKATDNLFDSIDKRNVQALTS